MCVLSHPSPQPEDSQLGGHHGAHRCQVFNAASSRTQRRCVRQRLPQSVRSGSSTTVR
jgi:hypothetical protein